MRSRVRRHLRARNVVLGLALTSVVMMLLPRELFAGLRSGTQFLLPVQEVVARMVEGGRRIVQAARSPGPAVLTDLNASPELIALRHQAVAQQARIDELQRQNLILSRYQGTGAKDARFIQALTVGHDSRPWRSSLLLAAGSRAGIRSGRGTLTACFVNAGQADRLEAGMGVLAGEALLGFVDAVDSHVSRVRLLGDPEARLAVAIGRLEGDKARLLPARFWLTGSDTGQIIVRDVEKRHLESGEVRLGDQVVTLDDDARLPAHVNIGTVDRALDQKDNPLLADLLVRPAVSPADIRAVYVVDTGSLGDD